MSYAAENKQQTEGLVGNKITSRISSKRIN